MNTDSKANAMRTSSVGFGNRNSQKKRTGAFTLIELMVVIAIIGTLVALLLPSLGRIRFLSKRAACASTLKSIGSALGLYVTTYNNRFPPFAYTDNTAGSGNNILEAGHWGGATDLGAGDQAGRSGHQLTNLWALTNTTVVCYENTTTGDVAEVPGAGYTQRTVTGPGFLSGDALKCPAADGGYLGANSSASYFGDTKRFSTYCMRMPYSNQLFNEAPLLKNYDGVGGGTGEKLDIYLDYGGGKSVSGVSSPVIRYGRKYNIVAGVDGNSDGDYYDAGDTEPEYFYSSTSAIVADNFWWQRLRSGEDGWCHDDNSDPRDDGAGTFNVLYGDWSVKTIKDIKTSEEPDEAWEDGMNNDNTRIFNNSNIDGDGNARTDVDNDSFNKYALKIWGFFDDQK